MKVILILWSLIFGLTQILCLSDALSLYSKSGVVDEDPAPGRAPGPPKDLESNTVPGEIANPCDLEGDLIVIDKEKAALFINFTHPLFETNVLTLGVIYEVTIHRRPSDSNVIQGLSLHSLADGWPQGHFSNPHGHDERCLKSSVKAQLNGDDILVYKWVLPLEQITKSNITFRLRYKILTSPSVFQVNYAFAVTQGCQIWLKRNSANISSVDFPRTDCLVTFPGFKNRHGLVVDLTRLNVPCSANSYLQFSENSASFDTSHNLNHNTHKRSHICGKLEELPESDRHLYFPNLRNYAPFLKLHNLPLFSLHYYLVDFCYNVTFTNRNGTFELIPSGNLECQFKIFLPYGNRIVLKLTIGDFSKPVANFIAPPVVQNAAVQPANSSCPGLLTELWEGSSSWIHCTLPGDAQRHIEIESRANRILMRVFVRSAALANVGGQRQRGVGLRFHYYADPIVDIVQQCSFGWVALRQHCVTAVENIKLSWIQAEGECVRRGGHLASVRSELAQEVVDQLLISSPGYRDQNAYWLGASDKTYEGDFRWSDGLPFSYANWFPGWSQHDHYNRQPNDDGLSEQDCVEVRRIYHHPSAAIRMASRFMWNDRDCSTLNYFLCERLMTDDPVEDGWPLECNRSLLLTREQPRASVSSPGFPRQYPDNAECETEITAPLGYRLLMDFEELVLEKEPYYDYLEIIEMNALNTSQARKLCGDWSAKLKLLRYVSNSSRVRLKFVSDYSHHYGGFRVRVSMENAILENRNVRQCADDRLVMYNNSCYLFVSYPEVTWSTAQQICKGLRAQLTSILSPEEERFITSNIRRSLEYRTSAVYWLGSKSFEFGQYKWVDGSQMTYTSWLPGQNPLENSQIKSADDTCLGIQWTSSPTPMLPSGLYWRSKKCSTVGGYVCKRRNQKPGLETNFNRVLNGREGRLTSPNYPSNYFNNLDFKVRIVGPERTRLIIQFSKLDLEPQLECLYDYVALKSVRSPEVQDEVKWCGNHDTDMERFDFVSETNEAQITFHSDYSISGSGFSITWHAVDVSGCPLQTLTAREGVLTSPNYPHFLLARLDCAITILAPTGKRVWLEIVDYDMGGSSFESNQIRLASKHKSDEAILELDLGGSSNVFRPFQISGQLTDGAFVSTGERLQIRLRTADKPQGIGFKALYKTVNGIQEDRIIDLTNITSGVLLHLNYPNHPPSHIDFLQHLVAPIGNIILLELYHVKFSETGCESSGSIDVYDNYADSNGTYWHLCYNSDSDESFALAPLAITSYLNTMHVRQKGGVIGIPLNGSLRVQADLNYKIKLLRQEQSVVESCNPNPCQNSGKCVSNGGRKFCKCVGHFTGLFCALTICELEPCVFGQCTLTTGSYRCNCQHGYAGATCEQKQRPCEGNPCEGRGECIERGESFHCRCHAWWEGQKCERRMLHIPYTPLSERMLHEPFWLGLITVTIVLAVIGLVWCARRHFPEKLEKLLAEESDRNRCPPTSLRGSSVREQLAGGASAAVMVVPSPQPGCQRSLFGRLGIRKPSILSLTSPHGQSSQQHATAAAARTFSLDDLLKPPPRRTPSPRKKRNNSTPTKKNAAEKKQILQQLISPGNQQRARKVSIGELIQLSEKKLKEKAATEGEASNYTETILGNNITSTAQITLTDPKLEKKVTFARLLNKVSAEMSSGSEVELGTFQGKRMTSLRAASSPPSPTADVRSPNSTSSNQGSDSLSSSDLALCSNVGRKTGLQPIRQKPASADSILAMFRNFSSTSAAANCPSSVRFSPATTPSISSPPDEGDDDSTTSSIHTPISFSSGHYDSPPNSRKLASTSIEVPVLDPLNHRANDCNNFLHPPTILLEVSRDINKCLSPIREMPTPLPSPCYTPIMRRNIMNSSAEDIGMEFSDDRISVEMPSISVCYSDEDDEHEAQDIAIDVQAEDGLIQEEAVVMQQASSGVKTKPRPPPLSQIRSNTISLDSDTSQSTAPPPLVIPVLTIQHPSPTHARPPLLSMPGSPPPHRSTSTIHDSNFHFPEKSRRLLKDFDKPTSLDLPNAPPLITITCNLSEADSDADSLSPITKKSNPHLGPPVGSVGMCYLSPFSMCSRADRTASESNLSSSGYSSMASPGPSRCGSNNPLCPSEMEDPGPSGPSNHSLLPRRPSPLLKTSSNSTTETINNNNSGDRRSHCRGRSDSETLSDDPLLESNDEGIGTDHLDEKIEEGELKSAKELELYIEKDVVDLSVLTVDIPKLPFLTTNILIKSEPILDKIPNPLCKVSLQLPSIVIEAGGCEKCTSPVSSRSESPLSDRTVGLGRFSPSFYNTKQKDLLPFTDSDGLYDFPSSDCAQAKVGATLTHRKSGRKREKKLARQKVISPTKAAAGHQCHLDVPSREPHHKVQTPRKPSPKRRSRKEQLVSSSSSSESLNSARELKLTSSPSTETMRWPSPTSWPDTTIARRRSHESSGEDTVEETFEVTVPAVADDLSKPNKKISRLRTIGHQIRFLRRLEKSMKRKDHFLADSIDSDNGEDFARVTSPLLTPSPGAKPEIRKSQSIGKLYVASSTLPGSKFKKSKLKRETDLLIPHDENWMKSVNITNASGFSD